MNKIDKTDSSHALKALKTQLRDAELEADASKQELEMSQQRVATAKAKVTKLHEKIKALVESEKDIVVTEHALLRYIERAYGIDLGEIKKEMLQPETVKFINEFKTGKIPAGADSEIRLIVKDRVVITVEPK